MWRARQELEESCSDSELPQYTALCSEMRSFLGVACSVGPMVRKVLSDAENMGKEWDSSQLQLVLAQLRSFAMSAVSFKQKLLDKFSSFVDISMTFLQALEIFVCALNEACGIMETVERRRELQATTAFPINFQASTRYRDLI
ncbi:unnamed protein product [Cylicostephanus goldi]|uniref:Uncharacterized protein n=1 Tax=Cylicostephanus goldi TaxID=71465 RepID=A0A3P6S912_CYLGO|nr:unnamed protein product [Cylicostephanus goldi]